MIAVVVLNCVRHEDHRCDPESSWVSLCCCNLLCTVLKQSAWPWESQKAAKTRCCVAVSGPAWAAEAGWDEGLEDCCGSSPLPTQLEAVEMWEAAALSV